GNPMAYFPVVRSVLDAEALADLIEPAYDLSGARCQLIKAMILDTYRVTVANGFYMLRIYPHKRRSLPEIQAELDFLLHLAGQGVPVSAPIPQKQGAYALSIPAPEGVRYGALFTYAPGEPLSQVSDLAIIQAYGRTIAQIHTAADAYTLPPGLARAPLDLEMLMERPLRDLEREFPQRAEDWAFLRQVGEIIRPQIAALPRENPQYGLLHGDVGRENAHVTADGKLTVFDFDFCGPGWRAYDIGTFLIDEPEEVQQAFLSGYQDVRRLEPLEQGTIPLFQILQHIWVLGIRADYVNEWGSAFFPARLADWIIHYIRERVKEIDQ
ncbi:MAG: phosphotransferase, partial [Anaerolineae bacterium]|nr:phosphotransferase [Anaerolineae bacterium]